MDVVLALTIEWYDKRLVWGLYDYTKEYAIPIKTIEVSSNHIWTPRNAIFNTSTLTSNKVACVFSKVVDSILPHAEFGSNDHQEDALNFNRLK